MRIGVITLEAGHNYGGILQCYATMRQLQKYGHDVEFLRVVPKNGGRLEYIKSIFATRSLKSLFSLKKSGFVFSPEESQEMTEVFDGFRSRYMKLSPLQTAETVGDYAQANYDAVLIGSDQTWAGLYNRNNAVFIGWKPVFKGKRLSYACCSPYSKLADAKRKHELAGYLNKFDYISVRDSNTQKLIRSIIGRDVDIVPDPTELSMFEEFVNIPRVIEGDYILTYVLGDEIKGGHKVAFAKIKEQYGDIPVIGVKTANLSTGVHAVADKMMDRLTPEQWVNLIYHAKAIYTDSFHAILFSMKYHKPFLAYYVLAVRSSRLKYLRAKYNTTNIVSSVDEIKPLEVVNNAPVDTTFFDKIMKDNGML